MRRLEARGELADLNTALAEEVIELFGEAPVIDVAHEPAVILVVGVNGTGKTTTIGKLSARLAEHGHSVVVAAAEERGAQVIVVGAHAKGRVSTVILGSTSRDVIRHAPLPVLVVREAPAT